MKKIYCNIKKCLGCGSCEIACCVEHSKSKDLNIAIYENPLPIKRRKVEFVKPEIAISTGCYHCEDAFCIDSCISGAMYKDKKTKQTKHNKDKCIGCWMCVMSCPYGAITRQKKEKLVVKCDLCPDRDIPSCVEVCPTGALFLGTIDEFKENLTICNT